MRMKMRGLVELNQIINTDLHNINHKTQSWKEDWSTLNLTIQNLAGACLPNR